MMIHFKSIYESILDTSSFSKLMLIIIILVCDLCLSRLPAGRQVECEAIQSGWLRGESHLKILWKIL